MCTCVLRDLSLGDHLFTLRIHQLAVFVLFQTLKNVPGISLSTEPLQESVCNSVKNQTSDLLQLLRSETSLQQRHKPKVLTGYLKPLHLEVKPA